MIDVAHVNELCLQGNRSIAMVVLCGLLSCGNGVGRMLWLVVCWLLVHFLCVVVVWVPAKVSIFLIDRERGYGSEISTSTENK